MDQESIAYISGLQPWLMVGDLFGRLEHDVAFRFAIEYFEKIIVRASHYVTRRGMGNKNKVMPMLGKLTNQCHRLSIQIYQI